MIQRILSDLYPSAILTEESEKSLHHLIDSFFQSNQFPLLKGSLGRKIKSLTQNGNPQIVQEYLLKEILELAIHSQVDFNLLHNISTSPLIIGIQALFSGITQDSELYLIFVDLFPPLVLAKEISFPISQWVISSQQIELLAKKFNLHLDKWGLQIVSRLLSIFLFNLYYYSEEEIEIFKKELSHDADDLPTLILSSLFDKLNDQNILISVLEWRWIGFLNYTP